LIRWKIDKILEKKGWTPHRLATVVGLTPPVAYRLVKPGAKAQRVDASTLSSLCKAFDCQPGALLEYIPSRREVSRKTGPNPGSIASIKSRAKKKRAMLRMRSKPKTRTKTRAKRGRR
jgi:putative transcriptional regulator